SQRYLDELRRHLTRLPQAERDDAVQEIESHIADARAAGMPLAAILARLGTAPSLARAYEADYLLHLHLPTEPELAPANDDTGRVVRIVGPVLDVQFTSGHAPEIYHALEVELDDDGGTLVVEVQQLPCNHLRRTVA